MAKDTNYPNVYYTTLKGFGIRYCQSIGDLKYCELYKKGDQEHEEIDITIRNKNALKIGLKLINSLTTQ